MPRKPEKQEYTFPKLPGACVDRFKELGDKKKAILKQAAAVEAEENALERHLVAMLEGMKAEVLAGRKGKAKLVLKDIPVFDPEGGDDQFYKYVKKTGAFHLLQKRLNRKAIEELWDSGKKVPGIKKFIAKKISITKV